MSLLVNPLELFIYEVTRNFSYQKLYSVQMDLSVSLNAKEVLFHLNYMGYRNVTKEQLKYFMLGK